MALESKKRSKFFNQFLLIVLVRANETMAIFMRHFF